MDLSPYHPPIDDRGLSIRHIATARVPNSSTPMILRDLTPQQHAVSPVPTAEFVETVLTGWWTTCLEVLPAKERRRGVA